MIDLDANFLIDAAAATAAARRVEHWAAAGTAVSISSVAWAEFLCGPLLAEHESWARSAIERIEPFTEADASIAARLFNDTGRRSRTLPDCMIAAVAIRRRAALATPNVSDFRPFVSFGLRLAV